MTTITLEAIQARQNELAEMIAKFSAETRAPSHFIYQDERIELNPGEIYVGTIITPGDYGDYHLILLPGEAESIDWKDAMNWAKEQGGELPNRVEGALLFATRKDEFQKEAYWTRDEHPDNAYAWFQSFDYGCQYYYPKDTSLRARAVRRLIIE